MAPRTRRARFTATAGSHTNGTPNEDSLDLQTLDHTSTSTQRDAEDQNNPNLSQSGVRTTHGKRTFVSSDTATTPPATQAVQNVEENPSKRRRTIAPVHARPMPLQLPSEGEITDAPVSDNVVQGKGKRVALQRSSSYYPNRGDSTHVLACLDTTHDSDPNEDNIEYEDDWMEDEHVTGVTSKVSARTSEAMVTERPSWQGVDIGTSRNLLTTNRFDRVSGHGSMGSAPYSTPLLAPESGAPTTELSTAATTLQNEAPERSVTPESSGDAWPTDTDLVSPPGTTKLMLTSQQPLVRAVVQDAIENLRASLMFSHAFPDAIVAFSFTKESLIAAAESHKPGATYIQRRLQQDEDYLVKIAQLPRARIPLLRSEVKERCNAITIPVLLAIGSPSNIAQVARRQLSTYNYTFPIAATAQPLTGTYQRTRPYRNDRIISAIRDLFFTGGKTSFASRFSNLFPVYKGPEGVSIREVPVPMVALVVTALYATLHEWRTGKQLATEFSANAYLDVYLGHINTFKHIQTKQPSAYHIMMADIYSQASRSPGDTASAAVAIADLDLNELEG
ncbi:hypothetical protein BJY52DRAFT_1193540 [Lactarius psammicola]|nr:hypothetical protein BJY52DRAFT_1193540 [Lactarius psammicola]